MTTDGLVEALREAFERYDEPAPDARKSAGWNNDGALLDRVNSRRHSAWVDRTESAGSDIIRLARTALATIQEDEGWRPISEAPELDRIFVAGWQKPQGRCAGYWWWHEDAVADGMAIEHPEATLWHPIRFAALPAAPQGVSDHTGGSDE